jgi:hypothetical protein
MESGDPPKRGEVRFRNTGLEFRNRYRALSYPSRQEHKSAKQLFIELVGLILLLIGLTVLGEFTGSSSGSGSGSGLGTASTRYITLPPKPALAGKYLAVISSDFYYPTKATVFKFEKLSINVVSSLDQIPQEARTAAIFVLDRNSDSSIKSAPVSNSPASSSAALRRWLANPMMNENLQLKAGSLKNPHTYIFVGDLTIEVGDLVSNDQMIASLVLRHGDLKKAAIEVVDGSPRGPPTKGDFRDDQAREIYVLGTVRSVRGPVLRGKSVLNALIIDLGPSPKQLDKYSKGMLVWNDEVRKIAEANGITDDALWRTEAEKDGVIRIDPPSPRSDPAYRGYDYGHDSHPVDHPVL